MKRKMHVKKENWDVNVNVQKRPQQMNTKDAEKVSRMENICFLTLTLNLFFTFLVQNGDEDQKQQQQRERDKYHTRVRFP